MRTGLKKRIALLMAAVLVLTMHQPTFAEGNAESGSDQVTTGPLLTISVNNEVIKTFDDVEVDVTSGELKCSLGNVYPGDVVAMTPGQDTGNFSYELLSASLYYSWDDSILTDEENEDMWFTVSGNDFVHTVWKPERKEGSKPVECWEMSIVFTRSVIDGEYVFVSADHFEFKPVEVSDARINKAMIFCPDFQKYVELENTVYNEEGKKLPEDNSSVMIAVVVDPPAAKGEITLKADKTGFFGMDTDETKAKANAFTAEELSLPYTAPSDGVQARIFYVAAAKSGFDDTKAEDIETEGRRAGVATITAYAGETELGSFTLYVDGYDTEEEVFYEGGKKVRNDYRRVGNTNYWFDSEGNRVTGTKIVVLNFGIELRFLVIDGNLVTGGRYKLTEGTTEKYYCVDGEGVIQKGCIGEEFCSVEDTAECVYYADPADGYALVTDALAGISGNDYYFDADSRMIRASAEANEYDNNDGKWKYYVNKDGKVAKSNIFKVNGVNRLFREDGTIVSYGDDDVIAGKITVDNVDFIIDPETNEACTRIIWTKKSVDWTVNYDDTADTAKAVFCLNDSDDENTTVNVEADKITVSEEGLISEGDVLTISEEDVAQDKTFTATLTFYGRKFDDKVTIKQHEHKWSLLEWNWTSLDVKAENTSAEAIFGCNEEENVNEKLVVKATVSDYVRKENAVIYKAIVIGPDDVTYTDYAYFAKDSSEPLMGWLTADLTATANAAVGVFYADPDADGKFVVDALKKVGDSTYYFNAECKKEKASAEANLYELSSDEKYYVNKKGNVAISGVFTVNGKNLLFDENGKIVTYDQTTDGKITIDGIVYTVGENGEAKSDAVWTLESVSWTVAYEDTAETAEAVFCLKDDSEAVNKVSKSADNIVTVSGNDVEKTFKATAYYMGYKFEDEKTVHIHTNHEWTVVFNWLYYASSRTLKEVTAVATCSVGKEYRVCEVKLEEKATGGTMQYTVTTRDPNGKTWKETKHVERVTGELMNGPAGTNLVEGGDILIVGLNDEGYPFSKKKAIQPAITVMDGDVVLAQGTDYSVKYKNNKKVTEAAIIEVTGKGNYQGKSTSATFKIYDPVAKDKADGIELIDGTVKKIAKINAVIYNGLPQYPEKIVVTMKDKSVVTMKHEGDGVYVNDSEDPNAKQLVVTVTNNVKKGSAIVAVAAGDGNVKTASFKINAADISKATVAADMEATFAVKGTRPDHITVFWKNGDDEEVELVEGQDFTVSIKDNKAVGTGRIILKGKGNFAKKNENGTFKINALVVDSPDDIAGVAAYEGVKAKAVKVTVLDGKGIALPAKALNVLVKDEEGNAVDNKTKLVPGKYSVVVTSKNYNVTIEGDGIEKEITVGANIGKAKVDAKKLKVTYTGAPIELTDEQLGSVIVTMKVGGAKKTLVAGEDFIVVGYTNNVKKGSMTVTIAGTGEETERGTFSGTKTFKVKIIAKSLDAKSE